MHVFLYYLVFDKKNITNFASNIFETTNKTFKSQRSIHNMLVFISYPHFCQSKYYIMSVQRQKKKNRKVFGFGVV